jgi:2'-5' RNA ligase
MRLFVALEIPSEVRSNLELLMKELRALPVPPSVAKQARWVRPENLHVTLKFLGEVAREQLEAVENTLSSVKSQAIELSVRGIGFFPSERRPRVLWAGAQAPPSLAALAGEIDQALAKLGFERETRAFAPHLTLARFEPPRASKELQAAAQARAGCEFGVLRTREFQLLESKLKPGGAEYTTLRSFVFAAEA